jgi:L-asparaginase/Glu-tRNA(Gln) amidotransferase subunit D
LQQAGAVLAGELSAWKARILLMLLLQSEQEEKGIEGFFEAQI